MNVRKYISTYKNNVKTISISIVQITTDSDSTPLKWEVYCGGWGNSDTFYADGLVRRYDKNTATENDSAEVLTTKGNSTVSVSVDSDGILSVTLPVSYSYVKLVVYYHT